VNDIFKRYMEHLEVGAGVQAVPFSDRDAAESIAILLKQMVLADGVEREEELGAALAILRKRYARELEAYSDVPLADSIEIMENSGHESIFPLCRILLKTLDAVELAKLRSQLVEIALADGELHPYEKDLLDLFDQLIRPPR